MRSLRYDSTLPVLDHDFHRATDSHDITSVQIHTNGLAAKTNVLTGQIRHITPSLHFAVASEIDDKPV